jgi:hypothetical protein
MQSSLDLGVTVRGLPGNGDISFGFDILKVFCGGMGAERMPSSFQSMLSTNRSARHQFLPI